MVVVALAFVGVLLFGAVGPTPFPGLSEKIEIRGMFLGLALACAGLALIRRRPSTLWLAIVGVFPAWIALQLLPLPAALRAIVSPTSADLLPAGWPEPLVLCGGALPVASADGWRPLAIVPSAAFDALLLATAVACAFLLAHACAWGGPPRRVACARVRGAGGDPSWYRFVAASDPRHAKTPPAGSPRRPHGLRPIDERDVPARGDDPRASGAARAAGADDASDTAASRSALRPGAPAVPLDPIELPGAAPDDCQPAASPRLAPARVQRLVLWAIAIYGAAQGLYGLAEWASGTPSVLWRPKFDTGAWASGTLINRNHYALLLYVGLGCAPALARPPASLLAAASRRLDGIGRDRDLAARIAAGIAAAVCVAGILASGSRAGAAAAVVVLASALPRPRGVRRGYGLAIVAAFAAVAGPVALVATGDLAGRFETIVEEWTGPSGRGAVVRASEPVVRDFLVTGAGAGSFGTLFPIYRPSDVQRGMTYAHNDWLQALIETGLVGLACALLPVLLYGAESVRRVVRDPRRAVPRPVLAALAMVALHALVDSGMHVPGIALVVAVLAGVFAPPIGRLPKVATIGLALVALAMVPQAIGGSLAQWSWLAGASWLPDAPEPHYSRALELARAADEAADEAADVGTLRCQAVDAAAHAYAMQPLNGWYALTYAEATARAAETATTTGAGTAAATTHRLARDAARLQQASRRAAGEVRRLDPWDPFKRRRLMRTSLALGAEHAALDDAVALMRAEPRLARGPAGVLAALDEAGVSEEALDGALRGAGALPAPDYRNVLGALLAEKRWTLAEALVPSGVAARDETCEAGAQVRSVLLRRRERDHARTFLRGCVRLAESAADVAMADRARTWLIAEDLRAGLIDAAEETLEGIVDRVARARAELTVARHAEDWERVVREAWRLLDLEDGASATRRAWIRRQLGEAYARRGRLDTAIDHFEEALRLDPLDPYAQRVLRELRAGHDPFG